MTKGGKILSKFGSKVLEMVAEGFDFEQVAEQEAQQRLDICRACENLEGDQCGLCGCNVEFKVTLKTNPVLTVFKAEKTENKCPAGNW